MKFREVKLPVSVTGKLYLHSMPGRYEPLAASWSEADRLGVDIIVCLAPLDEIKKKSGEYANAIEAGQVCYDFRWLPVRDYKSTWWW
jgi:hypothetical protein